MLLFQLSDGTVIAGTVTKTLYSTGASQWRVLYELPTLTPEQREAILAAGDTPPRQPGVNGCRVTRYAGVWCRINPHLHIAE